MIQFQLRGKTIKTEIQIWDTAGAERFKNIINANKNCSEDVKKQTMLVAIQLSDERKVTSDEAFLFAMQYDIFYTEVNESNSINVDQILYKMVKSYIYPRLSCE
ncbi:Ras-related_protein [Hexamita inflata]|uniref:Ras-related protein n=1 Tax=Hexamita inflata TaxID=28002 RepID=A0AA86QQ69_9EUKA|nr:Ras-related protein [Hexamita inflata]